MINYKIILISNNNNIMPCSICKKVGHNKNTHRKAINKSTKKSKAYKGAGGGPYAGYNKNDASKIVERAATIIGGAAKKGLLADLLKGIDLRIQSL